MSKELTRRQLLKKTGLLLAGGAAGGVLYDVGKDVISETASSISPSFVPHFTINIWSPEQIEDFKDPDLNHEKLEEARKHAESPNNGYLHIVNSIWNPPYFTTVEAHTPYGKDFRFDLRRFNLLLSREREPHYEKEPKIFSFYLDGPEGRDLTEWPVFFMSDQNIYREIMEDVKKRMEGLERFYIIPKTPTGGKYYEKEWDLWDVSKYAPPKHYQIDLNGITYRIHGLDALIDKEELEENWEHWIKYGSDIP
tara:strand:- start:700 stop:1455 length:756 start_codon:yes stop_codon:yes gene_type:complete